MKQYTVYASQIVMYKKTIEASSIEKALEKAWEDNDCDWKEYDSKEWQLDNVEVVKE
jgi:hypothetical protein